MGREYLICARFLTALGDRGAYLSVGERGKLIYHGPKEVLTDDLRAEIRERRQDLLGFFHLTEDDLSDEVLAVMGYRRPGSGRRNSRSESLPAGSRDCRNRGSP